MLSRVAERIYWAARYLERAENTARLVSVYDNLLFDLPRDTNISWYNLIIINSTSESFHERYKIEDEHNVVKFLLADDTNPGSLLSTLRFLRENLRTTRDVVPKDIWELINELDMYARQHIKQGINRTQRHAFLNTIIKGCQEINGLLGGTMSRDAAWQFVVLGRNIERADMTSRILDAGTFTMLQPRSHVSVNLGQVVWGNVLRSLSADLNYRRAVRSSVNAHKVARFLIEDSQFPRTVSFCINELKQACFHLPNPDSVLGAIDHVSQLSYHLNGADELSAEFRDYLNALQIQLCTINDAIADNWFNFSQGDAA